MPDIPDDDAPTGRALSKRTSKTVRLLEAQQILEQHVAGVEDVRICQAFGISRATMYRRIREARDFVLDPTVEEYRAEAVARVREARRRVYDTLNQQDPYTGAPTCAPTDVAALIGRLVQLEDIEAKVRGGYAPTQVRHEHVVRDAFAELLDELNGTAPTPTREESTP